MERLLPSSLNTTLCRGILRVLLGQFLAMCMSVTGLFTTLLVEDNSSLPLLQSMTAYATICVFFSGIYYVYVVRHRDAINAKYCCDNGSSTSLSRHQPIAKDEEEEEVKDDNNAEDVIVTRHKCYNTFSGNSDSIKGDGGEQSGDAATISTANNFKSTSSAASTDVSQARKTTTRPHLLRRFLAHLRSALTDGYKGVGASLWRFAIIALIDLEANFAVVYAYQYTDITSVQLLDCSSIVWVMILSTVFLGARYKPLYHMVGAGIAVCGIILLIVFDATNMNRHSGGDDDGGGGGDNHVNASSFSFAFAKNFIEQSFSAVAGEKIKKASESQLSQHFSGSSFVSAGLDGVGQNASSASSSSGAHDENDIILGDMLCIISSLLYAISNVACERLVKKSTTSSPSTTEAVAANDDSEQKKKKRQEEGAAANPTTAREAEALSRNGDGDEDEARNNDSNENEKGVIIVSRKESAAAILATASPLSASLSSSPSHSSSFCPPPSLEWIVIIEYLFWMPFFGTLFGSLQFWATQEYKQLPYFNHDDNSGNQTMTSAAFSRVASGESNVDLYYQFGFGASMLVIYTLMPVLFFIASATFANLSLLTSDIFSIFWNVTVFNIFPKPTFFISFVLILVGVIIFDTNGLEMLRNKQEKDDEGDDEIIDCDGLEKSNGERGERDGGPSESIEARTVADN